LIDTAQFSETRTEYELRDFLKKQKET